jgi:hypothetical protein
MRRLAQPAGIADVRRGTHTFVLGVLAVIPCAMLLWAAFPFGVPSVKVHLGIGGSPVAQVGALGALALVSAAVLTVSARFRRGRARGEFADGFVLGALVYSGLLFLMVLEAIFFPTFAAGF